MKLSYDYSEFLEEFEDEITDGLLKLEDMIWIVRDDNPLETGYSDVKTDYRPIIDWYYIADFKDEDLKHRVLNDDRFSARKIKVKDVIAEMEEWDSVL